MAHKRRHGVVGSMRLADQLWQQIVAQHGPAWNAERRADRETHQRVSEALQRVQEKNRRR